MFILGMVKNTLGPFIQINSLEHDSYSDGQYLSKPGQFHSKSKCFMVICMCVEKHSLGTTL